MTSPAKVTRQPRETASDGGPAEPRELSDRSIALLGLLTALASAALVTSEGLIVALVPLAALVGAAIALMAAERFEWFVISALLMRSSLDAVRAGPGIEPAQLLGLAFLGCAALWLLGQWRSGEWVPLWLPTKLLLLFSALCALSLAGADRPSEGIVELSRIVAAAVMLVVLNQIVTSRAAVLRYTTVLFAAAIIPVTVGIVQLTTNQSLRQIGSLERVDGTFLHPNPFAMFCGIVVVMGVAILGRLRARDRKWLFLITGACGVNLLFTYTRGAWVAVAVGIAVVCSLVNPRLILVIAALLVATYVLVPSIAERVQEVGESERVGADANNSLTWRFAYWQESLSLVEENPVTGIGLKGVSETTAAAKQPHNDYVRTLVETGVLGFLAFCAFTIAAIAEVWRAVKRAPDGFPRAIAVGALGSMASFVVFALSANVISQVVVLWYLALVIAVGIGAGRVPHPTQGRSPTAAASPSR